MLMHVKVHAVQGHSHATIHDHLQPFATIRHRKVLTGRFAIFERMSYILDRHSTERAVVKVDMVGAVQKRRCHRWTQMPQIIVARVVERRCRPLHGRNRQRAMARGPARRLAAPQLVLGQGTGSSRRDLWATRER